MTVLNQIYECIDYQSAWKIVFINVIYYVQLNGALTLYSTIKLLYRLDSTG